jgi:hypothetical protein
MSQCNCKERNLKLSQSPNFKTNKFNFIFGNPFENPDGEQRAESRETNIVPSGWTAPGSA